MSLRERFRESASSPHPDGRPGTLPARLLAGATRFERELWFLAIAAMLVDVTLTVHGLQLGLAETNPVARLMMDAGGVLGLYALKVVAIAVGGCCRPLVEERFSAVIPLGLAVPSLCAVSINIVTIGYVAV